MRYRGLRPPYPKFTPQRDGGDLPAQFGPPDLWPSQRSLVQSRGVRGRRLAGLGEVKPGEQIKGADMQSADGIKDYANELDVLAAADDVLGNGVFDPDGTVGTTYPDYGVFADHVNLPGYVAREKSYAPSEVIDGTTGRPVMYVPGGAVAIDRAQKQAFENRNLWTLPPGVNPWPIQDVMAESDVIPNDPSWPIGQTDVKQPASAGKMFAIAAVAGLSAGLLAALVWPK